MAINTNERQQVEYFVGNEVENTAMKGNKTLFVVGIKPFDDIVKLAKKHHLEHIYLGASQSFTPITVEEWHDWDHLITNLLNHGFWVTLDFDVQYAGDFHEYGWCEFNTFIPMISVKIPSIRLYNYNTTVKIDDVTWGESNPGVWCHPLNELMTRDVYSDWSSYANDKVL